MTVGVHKRKPITWYQLHKRIGKQTIHKTRNTRVQVLINGELKECALVFTNNGSDFHLEIVSKETKDKANTTKSQQQWYSEKIKPEEDKRVIVRDKNGKEYRNHVWTGHAWYSFSGCDGWRTDVEVVSWRYQ